MLQLQAAAGTPNIFESQFYGDENGCHAGLRNACLKGLEGDGRDNAEAIRATASEIFDAYEEWLCP
jgi:hypothetical protein